MAKPKVAKSVKVNLPTGEVAGEKKERTIETIQQEFGALCARTGQLQYQATAIKDDLAVLNKQIRDLNFEAAALKDKEAPVAQKGN